MKEQKGFVSIIILVIIALAAAKYFWDWSIFEALSSEEGQGTVSYVKAVLDVVWGYIGEPVMWAWNNIAWPLLSLAWESFQKIIEMGRDNVS